MSLCFPADDVVSGFVMLIESADDTALDNPVVVEDLAMFLARAVVDEVLAPQHLEEIGTQCLGPGSVGSKVLRMTKSLLKARLAGERILRCWGGGGSSRPGWAFEDVKDMIGKLLEEYESGGEIVRDQEFLGKFVERGQQGVPGFALGAARHAAQRIRLMQPARSAFGRALHEDAGDFQSRCPIPLLGAKHPTQFQHVRMVLLRRSNLRQLRFRLGRVAQLQPANGGGKIMRVWRFE